MATEGIQVEPEITREVIVELLKEHFPNTIDNWWEICLVTEDHGPLKQIRRFVRVEYRPVEGVHFEIVFNQKYIGQYWTNSHECENQDFWDAEEMEKTLVKDLSDFLENVRDLVEEKLRNEFQ